MKFLIKNKIYNFIQWIRANYYQWFIKTKECLHIFFIEIYEDFQQWLIDYEKNFHKTMDDLEAVVEREKKYIFAQGPEGWKLFYDDYLLCVKCSPIIAGLVYYCGSVDNPLYISHDIFITWEELKIILPPIVEGPVWNENIGKIYFYEKLQFIIDPNIVYNAMDAVMLHIDLNIGVNWFLC